MNITDIATSEQATTEKIIERPAQLYPRSRVDRLTDWVQSLPGPSWLFYVLLPAVLWIVTRVLERLGF